jgi:hypothetical protein
MQINMQHSRIANDNIMKLIQQDKSDIIFLQEPYQYQNIMAGKTKSRRNSICQEEKWRAAIIITKK